MYMLKARIQKAMGDKTGAKASAQKLLNWLLLQKMMIM